MHFFLSEPQLKTTVYVYIPLILEPFLEAIPQVVIALVYQYHISFSRFTYSGKIQVNML